MNIAKLPELVSRPSDVGSAIMRRIAANVNALYLIFKFGVAHRQSFDDDIRALPHIQACRKQTHTNLEFMHDALRTV